MTGNDLNPNATPETDEEDEYDRIEREQRDLDGQKALLDYYGGIENMMDLRPLTYEEIAAMKIERINEYLSWPNQRESSREAWREELEYWENFANQANKES